jgi:hypothetical protein
VTGLALAAEGTNNMARAYREHLQNEAFVAKERERETFFISGSSSIWILDWVLTC